MKNQFLFKSLLVVLILSASCSSQKQVAVKGGASSIAEEKKLNNTVEVSENDKALSLANYLRRIPGLQVTGDGDGASVIVRGMAAANERPLFVVDGRKMGNDFATINSLLDPNDIKSVQVLKDAGSTSFYGLQGSGGVIKIISRKK